MAPSGATERNAGRISLPMLCTERLYPCDPSMKMSWRRIVPCNPIRRGCDQGAGTREIHTNTWDEEAGHIRINDAQIHAFEELNDHYTRMFTDPEYPEVFQTGYITDPEDIRNLTAFFYWGGWVSGANRPGEDYSYTHNWPYDPAAGNTPTSATYIWSVLSILALFLGIGVVLVRVRSNENTAR